MRACASRPQECGDFKRGACFRATCKFMHNGRPASEFSQQGIPGSTNNGQAGLPTPKAAGAFQAPEHLDHSLYDPSTGFGLWGTSTFGTRYGMIGNLPKIENVRPLCMDFFKQGFCNRRGPHNQGCLFRHDEIEGKGKIADVLGDAGIKVSETAVELFTMEAQGRVGPMSAKMASSDVADAAAEYAKRREAELVAQEAAEKAAAQRKAEQERLAAEAAARGPPAAAPAAANGEAAAEAPLPAGWKATKAADGRTYYYNSLTKKTQWTRPKPDDGAAPADGAPPAAAAGADAPLPAGWKSAKAPDGRTYYFAPGEKTRWTRPTEPTGAAAAPAAAPATPAAAPATPAPNGDAPADSTAAEAPPAAAPAAEGAAGEGAAEEAAAADDEDAHADKRARTE
jgi:pre-mRNA-processing factor 40